MRKCYLGFSAVCAARQCLQNFVAIDPTKRSDTWALQRADVDCKAQVHSEKWFDRWHLRHRVDPI